MLVKQRIWKKQLMTNLLDTIRSVANKKVIKEQVSPKPVKADPISNKLIWPKKKVIKESEHDSYKLVIISHDDPLDPNETAPMIRKNAKRIGIEVHLCELMGAYLEDGPGKDKLLYSYPVDDEGKAQLPTMKKQSEYAKPITINPDNTIIMMRGLNAKDGCASWWVMGRTLENAGFQLINSVVFSVVIFLLFLYL